MIEPSYRLLSAADGLDDKSVVALSYAATFEMLPFFHATALRYWPRKPSSSHLPASGIGVEPWRELFLSSAALFSAGSKTGWQRISDKMNDLVDSLPELDVIYHVDPTAFRFADAVLLSIEATTQLAAHLLSDGVVAFPEKFESFASASALHWIGEMFYSEIMLRNFSSGIVFKSESEKNSSICAHASYVGTEKILRSYIPSLYDFQGLMQTKPWEQRRLWHHLRLVLPIDQVGMA